MKNYLKRIIVCFLMSASTVSFSADKDRTGFLFNLRELKEISDIMDLI
ncbi:MAG: peptidase S41, partial [Fusobacteriales bacterium]